MKPWDFVRFSQRESAVLLLQSVSCVQPQRPQHPRPPVLHCLLEFAQTHVTESMMPSTHLIPCSQCFPASGPFPVSWLFPSGGHSTGASASASVLPVNTQDWSPLGRTGWLSVQSRGLSGTTDWKHRSFGTQPSLWHKPHSCTWRLENHSFDRLDLCWQSDVCFLIRCLVSSQRMCRSRKQRKRKEGAGREEMVPGKPRRPTDGSGPPFGSAYMTLGIRGWILQQQQTSVSVIA